MTPIKARIVTGLLAMLAAAATPAISHPGAGSAIDHYSHELEHRPGDPSLYLRRGVAYSNNGEFDRALADFQRAQALGDPVLADFDLGVVHYRRGDFAAARASFDRYLARFPNHSAGLEYRARLLRDMGDYSASLADFRRVFALQPQPNPGHYISAADMLSQGGDEGIARALAIIDEGTEKIGLTPQLQQRAVALEVTRGRCDLAIQRLQTLYPMLGDSPSWTVSMAELKQAGGETAEAEQLFHRARQQLDSLRKTPAREALAERITVAGTAAAACDASKRS
ncbi:hypothetical protein DWB85_12645 [Seongchinamella sediminis]|uniref:Uncharacterized protein n=1 Tax=Seongchinamella sediminis TaxID=2283635 RepID=A0A3L7DZS6_9GAMM|nr:tetratricopeptide repeat protein [Seongchinamella sediminis]RLQ21372.1 hypothetical protein DWB85_12645 [Seongchinamella sediminis]